MEKLFQMKNSFLFKFLPKQPVASFAFQNPTLSPPRSPVSIIPKEARRKHRDDGSRGMSFTAKEPSSPKVSCMGQVQCKKKKMAQKHKRVQQLEANNKSDCVLGPEKKEEKVLLWMISKGTKQSGKGFVLEERVSSASKAEAPSLGMMKKFASGRGTLCDVDFELAERRFNVWVKFCAQRIERRPKENNMNGFGSLQLATDFRPKEDKYFVPCPKKKMKSSN